MVKKNFFYAKFLGLLMKKGKKSKIKKFLDKILIKVARKTKIPVNFVLCSLFLKLNTFVELRKICSRRSFHLVPFNISFSRRSFLVLKWLIISIKEEKKRMSLVNKFVVEIHKVLKNSSQSKALKLKSLNNSQAFANKANIHFRW